ncbi:MAG: uroporphyrinogen-III synthase [Chloroflexi bacterium]|nr:uroporphyrinogen-III synthase [Chloroflexota bacterium]
MIACLEARYASELADLVTRHGGITYQAPCLREVHLPDAAETRLAVDLICSQAVDVAIFLTGVGVQTMVEGARRSDREAELLDALAEVQVAARGPKAQNALRRLGVRVDLIAPEPFTSAALLERIQREWTLVGSRVLVQLYGAPVPAFTGGLRQLGAEVTEVSPYRWERPEDEEPVVRLIEDLAAGWIDVLAATSAAQVDHLFAIAQQRGHEETLRQALGRPELHVAAQGIVCASAFERRGVEVDLIPRHASMGALVVEIANTPGNCPISSSATAPGDGTVAVVAGRDVERDCIARALAGFGPRTTVAVVAGRSPLVQQVAIEHGLAVQCFPSDRTDAMIQRATSVLVLNGARRNLQAGRVLKLAGRYAKPVQIIEPPHTP